MLVRLGSVTQTTTELWSKRVPHITPLARPAVGFPSPGSQQSVGMTGITMWQEVRNW